jgi:methylthioribulose-1-phosphate dehydratase
VESYPNFEQICTLLRHIASRGWCDATGGNFSFRPNKTDILITRSGIFKGEASREDFVLIDSNGDPFSEDIKTSDETLIHSAIYRNSPDATVVLHTHSSQGTALSLLHKYHHQIRFTGMEMQKALPGCNSHNDVVTLPLFTNSQDILELSNHIEDRWEEVEKHQGLYIIGHGLYSWGNSAHQARRHLEGWEFLIATSFLMTSFERTSC